MSLKKDMFLFMFLYTRAIQMECIQRSINKNMSFFEIVNFSLLKNDSSTLCCPNPQNSHTLKTHLWSIKKMNILFLLSFVHTFSKLMKLDIYLLFDSKSLHFSWFYEILELGSTGQQWWYNYPVLPSFRILWNQLKWRDFIIGIWFDFLLSNIVFQS